MLSGSSEGADDVVVCGPADGVPEIGDCGFDFGIEESNAEVAGWSDGGRQVDGSGKVWDAFCEESGDEGVRSVEVEEGGAHVSSLPEVEDLYEMSMGP